MTPTPAGLEPAAGPAAAPDAPTGDDAVFVFRDGHLHLTSSAAGESVPAWREVELLVEGAGRRLFLGHLGSRPAWTLELRAGENPISLVPRSLRACFFRLGEEEVQAAARAVQLLAWDRDHRYCGRCGAETAPRSFEYDRQCTSCALSHFPRLAPAVIVLIHRRDEILLARGPQLPGAMFSTLAGFVEPGESLEQALHREVAEEVGVRVTDLAYFGSQPWPFPHSLMVGFFARWQAGSIRLEAGPDGRIEIEEASWFHLDDLPTIPPRISIARSLIDAYREARRDERDL